MGTWSETLTQFATAVRTGGELAPHLARCIHYPLRHGVEVYRNNLRGNLNDALALAYPILVQLVGADFFKLLARRFIERYPSHSGNVHQYGGEMAEFLTHFAPARQLPYLPDMAQLEWACHCAYYAENAVPLDLGRLDRIAPEAYVNLRWKLNPACALLASRYPIVAIWQAHQPDALGDFQINLACGGEAVLVTRVETLVEVSRIDAAMLLWLQQLQQGATLGTASAAALSVHAGFDLTAALTQAVTQKVLIDFEPGSEPGARDDEPTG